METQGKAVLFQPSRRAKGIYLIMALPAGYLLYSFIESIGWPWAIPLILWLVGWLTMGRDYRFLEGKADATPDEVAVLRLLVPFGRTPEWLAEGLGLGLAETGDHLHSLRAKGYVTRPSSQCGGLSARYYLVKPSRRAVRWMQRIGGRKQETVTA